MGIAHQLAMTPRVFTIPPSAAFLPTLIKALITGELGLAVARDPLALAAVTLYLPSRRACRLARDAFLDVLQVEAAILPRIVAIGDVDEDEIAFAEAAAGDIAGDALALPPALPAFERRLLLTRLVMQWIAAPEVRGASGVPLVARTPAAACTLADDLARLIDDMTMRGVSWDRVDNLVPEEFDKYWQLTLKFLQIARERWPEILNERGCIEAAQRRDALIRAEAARLARGTDGPVIAAGSTGSIPATAELIATISRLRRGAVVLPGLDTELDEPSWRLIAGEPGHPQFAMQALLARIGIARAAVVSLNGGWVEAAGPALGRPDDKLGETQCASGYPSAGFATLQSTRQRPHDRERLVSEALRPTAATELWRERANDAAFAAHADAALENVSVIEAATAEEESFAIAVALREAVHEGKTAALVTPDRALARRVSAALGRWNIAAEDSGGEALIDTPAGIFARLAAEAALGGLAPVSLLALLNHPLLRLGLTHRERAVATLELAVLRGPRPRSGSDGLKHALNTLRLELEKFHRGEASGLRHSDPRTRLRERELADAADLVDSLGVALTPLERIAGQQRRFSDMAARHREVLAALSRQDGDAVAFAGLDGTAIAQALDELATSEAAAAVLIDASADYVELFSAALGARYVRPPPRSGARVRILGTVEARLTESDRVVLGGFVEGTWPPESGTDAWLSRPMRQTLGLDLPERRIGLSAHDFAQLLGAREVILSHAGKIAGAPTTPSRFAQRLAAVAGKDRWQAALGRGASYLSWARAIDRPEKSPQPAPRPEPKPPRAARPKSLSVTDIENWLRDPYTIYAKYILRLAPLDAVDVAPGAAERGTIIHKAIGDFAQRFAEGLPADAARELIDLGEPLFAEYDDFPEVRAFWWPRFQRIARWFADWEAQRRPAITAIAAEIRGEIEIPLADGTFKLRGIADRVERRADGCYVILDYKTGSARTESQVRTGLAPQLTLEAAILRNGGFAGIIRGATVAQVGYVLLKGGAPAGEPKLIAFKEGDADSQADAALEKLARVARRFIDEEEPYRSLVHPMWTTHYGEYDHLARVKEWSATGGEIDDFWSGA